MAEKIRTKSDSLWRLVKTLTDSTVDTLRRQTELSGRDEEKFKLVAFYRGQSVYDREQEKAAWENNTTYLKVLKYRTYAWLVSQLAVISSFPHDDVHRLIGEIKVQMFHGCYPDVLEYIDKAKTICKERELFYQWREILHLEIKAASKSLQASELLSRIAGIRDAINELDEKIEDLERWDDVKMDYELQLKATHEENSALNEKLFEDYVAFMNGTQKTDRIRSKMQYLFHAINLEIFSNVYKNVSVSLRANLEHARVLRSLFGQYEWARNEDIEDYATSLMRMVGFAAERSDKAEASEILKQIRNLDQVTGLTMVMALEKVIFSYFFLERCLSEIKLGLRASELFVANRMMLKGKMREIPYLWMTFYDATFIAKNGDFLDRPNMIAAKERIEDVLGMKIQAKIDIQSHLKTLKICFDFIVAEEYSGFGISCKSAIRSFENIATNTAVQTFILQTIDAISKAITYEVLQDSIWKEGVQELQRLKESGAHLDTFESFDYSAFFEKMYSTKSCLPNG